MNDSIHINPPRLLRSVKKFTLPQLQTWISSCEYLQKNGIDDYNYQSTIQTLLAELKVAKHNLEKKEALMQYLKAESLTELEIAKQNYENVSKNLFPTTILPNGTL